MKPVNERSSKIPVVMSITIDSAVTAIEYWLNEVMLKESVEVQEVVYVNNEFKIKFNRPPVADIPQLHDPHMK